MKTLGTVAVCCGLAAAQQHHHSGAAGEKPVALYPGLGIWKHPIATTNAEAQKFFDQGLILLYSFNRPEALRSFRKALELDPKAAMAQWGVAMSIGPYINMDGDPDVDPKKSCEAAQAGLKMEGIGETDRAWLEASAARCPDFSDPSKYVAAMRALAARFPDDPDAQTLYAESLMVPVRWRWYDSKGNAAPGMDECERVLERVLRRYPTHPGANHFYIHAVESSPTPERAVPSAQRLMGIVPAAGHMVHMPGHIWLVLGEYNYAADVNERAVEVDREYLGKTGMMSTYYVLYLHNMDFIRYARSMQGRVADVKKAIAQLKEANGPMAQISPEFASVIDSTLLLTQVRNQLWDEILAAPKPTLAQTEWVWRYARAQAMFAKARTNEARAEQQEFEKIGTGLDRNGWWGVNKLGDVMDLAYAVLEARLSSSPEKWRQAVELQDRLAYDEPPAWYYPVRESLGASLLASGDARGAEEVFREGLRRSPHNGRMLFGLLGSLKAQKNLDGAAWVQREFESAWKGADLQLRLKDM
jgi:tetratricopeptide (TPR) repeat protein